MEDKLYIFVDVLTCIKEIIVVLQPIAKWQQRVVFLLLFQECELCKLRFQDSSCHGVLTKQSTNQHKLNPNLLPVLASDHTKYNFPAFTCFLWSATIRNIATAPRYSSFTRILWRSICLLFSYFYAFILQCISVTLSKRKKYSHWAE